MRCFNIEFIKPAPKNVSPELAYGRIQIGEFSELFQASLVFWKEDDYRVHWYRSIDRIVAGQPRSCLITSLVNPQEASYIFWWPCYRIEDSVMFQNQILFFDQLTKPFDLENPYKSIFDRETLSDDGSPISEWAVSISSLVQFLSEWR